MGVVEEHRLMTNDSRSAAGDAAVGTGSVESALGIGDVMMHFPGTLVGRAGLSMRS
jgi:hypothetical protein